LYKHGKFSRLFWVKVFHNDKDSRTHVWQRGYHPKAVFSAHFFKQKLTYIHANPVRKGYIEKPEYWKYSSARNYLLGDNSLIVIDEISW
jgi:putative transposase